MNKKKFLQIQYFEISLMNEKIYDRIQNDREKMHVQMFIDENKSNIVKSKSPLLLTRKFIKWNSQDSFPQFQIPSDKKKFLLCLEFYVGNQCLAISKFLLKKTSGIFIEPVKGYQIPFKIGQLEIQITSRKKKMLEQQSIEIIPKPDEEEKKMMDEKASQQSVSSKAEKNQNSWFSCFGLYKKKPSLKPKEKKPQLPIGANTVIQYSAKQISEVPEIWGQKRIINEIIFYQKP